MRTTTEGVEIKIPTKNLSASESLDPSQGQIETDVLDLDNTASKAFLDQVAWESQNVEVTILPSGDPEDRVNRVVIIVNGKEYPFLRGRPKVVPRFVLGQLASQKRDRFSFGHKFDSRTGEPINTNDQMPALKYPHAYTSLATSPEEVIAETKWYRNQLNFHF